MMEKEVMKMAEFTREEVGARKKRIFDSMGSRGQKHILKKGYEKWDPFEEPKDPIDIRKDGSKRTAQMLVREFLQAGKEPEYSENYSRAVLDMCMGIINNDERYLAMFDFSLWYKELLEKEGHPFPGLS
jgi:hypothetical protein